jgi:hypothetical protein
LVSTWANSHLKSNIITNDRHVMVNRFINPNISIQRLIGQPINAAKHEFIAGGGLKFVQHCKDITGIAKARLVPPVSGYLRTAAG